MEVPVVEPTIRTCTYNRRKTLADGTVKEYQCVQKYVSKTGNIAYGKKELKQRITACKDREKLDDIRALFNDLGI